MNDKQRKAMFAKNKSYKIPDRYAPKQKNESEIHHLARKGLILIPYNWQWSERRKRMIDTKTNKPIEGI